MLKIRVLTALVLLPLTVAAVLWLPTFWFVLISGMLITYAAWEWGKLTQLSVIMRSFLSLLTSVLVLCIAYMHYLGDIMLLTDIYNKVFVFLLIALVFWLFALYIIVKYPDIPTWLNHPLSSFLMAILMLWPAWLVVTYLQTAPIWLLLLFSVVWLADTVAYFTGSWFGQHKLAPKVSPNKSIEGLLGAIIIVPLIILLAGSVFSSGGLWSGSIDWLVLLLLVLWLMVTILFSVIGDLFESVFKRMYGVKDSGTCLPGHGGLLDRIDALLAAAPAFVLPMIILQLIGFYST